MNRRTPHALASHLKTKKYQLSVTSETNDRLTGVIQAINLRDARTEENKNSPSCEKARLIKLTKPLGLIMYYIKPLGLIMYYITSTKQKGPVGSQKP